MGLAACGTPTTEPAAPSTAAVGASAQEDASLREETEPKSAPAFAALNVADIEKADEAGLVELLGKPAFERKDRDARLLRFKGETCQISAFLYAGQAAGSWKIDHLEARDLKGKSMQTAQCLKAFKRLPA